MNKLMLKEQGVPKRNACMRWSGRRIISRTLHFKVVTYHKTLVEKNFPSYPIVIYKV
jgi:hypothetical protein